MVSTLAPQPADTNNILLEKILRLCNQLNGGPVSEPYYFPEGSTPYRGDTNNIALQKICGALYNLTSSGGGPGTWGVDGNNVVRKIANVYVLDDFTGLYHAIEATSEFSPGIVQMGLVQTGYAFAAIPD